MGKLSQDNLTRLANLVALYELRTLYQRLVMRDEPPAWIVHPEQAVLTLSSPLGPDQHPRVWISVPDGSGVNHGWGWTVNTGRRVYVPRPNP